MKATIDIPDELYRKVKAKSALEGRPVRAVTIELFERWLQEETSATTHLTQEEWLERMRELAHEASKNPPPGSTATEILTEDRNRLERIDRTQLVDEQSAVNASARVQALERVFRRADELMKNAPPGPTAREILEEGRNRLEHR